MAKKLDSWPHPSKFCTGNARYNWDLWFNGKVWTIVQGRDFDCTVQSMRNYIYIAAKRHNVTVETASLRNRKAIRFVANPQ